MKVAEGPKRFHDDCLRVLERFNGRYEGHSWIKESS